MKSKKRKELYDKGKCERELEVDDDLILCNIPWLKHKLEDSWDGMMEKHSQVNCLVEEVGGKNRKVRSDEEFQNTNHQK